MADTPSLSLLRKKRAALDRAIRALECVQSLNSAGRTAELALQLEVGAVLDVGARGVVLCFPRAVNSSND